ncbi:abortive infection family protein [Janthinobacterium sp. 78]|uniref:abortive infection family protein n=1 Tax=Janthinobacterium sp. 78 TaxID=2135631 RepID=UPI000D5C68BF|nr:abortive infection family protein [Janthinobacterium sp. 78]PVX34828.1 abortive infection Abi-like protein [Janthinobacterium sp. 78]
MQPQHEQIEALQNVLVARATGVSGVGDDAQYSQLRQLLLADGKLAPLLPSFVRTSRTLNQFWPFIQAKFAKYAERREYIWAEFRPILDFLEGVGASPSDAGVTSAIAKFDGAHVQAAWHKALERRTTDPEGAITSARTLLESVCKHILDASGTPYEDSPDMNKLYRQTAERLNIAPTQHTEQVFKQILGGCTAVVEGLGALRNRLSDSHGKGKAAVKPAPRHAELAVNLAGALAMYLLATWEAKSDPG